MAVAVAKKGEDLPDGVGVLNFERGRAAGILERPWETDTSVYQNSWGYINDIKYYTADYLIDEYRSGKNVKPVIIMGHSLGADAAVNMGNYLAGKRVPVRLIVAFDGVAQKRHHVMNNASGSQNFVTYADQLTEINATVARPTTARWRFAIFLI